ncbi:MAG: hypothetical protein JXQ27_05485 [Acidobacteria bacterium]|nr:hypothetical protein [Acidobacteriota bacterium]
MGAGEFPSTAGDGRPEMSGGGLLAGDPDDHDGKYRRLVAESPVAVPAARGGCEIV